jgi:cell division protein FtsQ
VALVEGEDNPRLGDSEAEEESPYLRRQKTVAVRRKRFSNRLRWLLPGAAGLLFLGTVGYWLGSFAVASPRFTLGSTDDIAVDGNQYVPREEILGALGLRATGSFPAAVNMFRLSLAEKRKQVESIPWVRSVTLTRAYPHRLAIHIEERVPLAFANVSGRLKVVDSEGVFLEKPERAVFDFPVLTGLERAVNLTERKLRLRLFQDFETEAAGETSRSGWMVSEINLADADDLKALMVQGPQTIQLHFGDKDFLERFRSFLALLPEARKANTKIESVDLRYQNQIVVNPQPARGNDK